MNGSRISGGIMQEHHRCWGACSWHTGITDCAHTTRVIPPTHSSQGAQPTNFLRAPHLAILQMFRRLRIRWPKHMALWT